jgi:hypothetical protein
MVDDFQQLGYLRVVKRREIRVYCGTHARDSSPSLERRRESAASGQAHSNLSEDGPSKVSSENVA